MSWVRVLGLLLVVPSCDQTFGITTIPDPSKGIDAALVIDGPTVDAPPNCFTEGFDGAALDPSHWQEWKTPTAQLPQVALAGGVLTVTPQPTPASTAEYNGAETVAPYDLTDATIVVEMIQAASQDPGVETQFRIRASDTDSYVFTAAKGQLIARETTSSQVIDPVYTTYDPQSDRWLRLRHDSAAQRMNFGVSANGTSWVTISVVPAIAPVTALHIGFGAGTYAAAPQPGQAQFDNVTTTGPACLP